MRILVVGLPKSGTTILTYRIAEACDEVVVEFEPVGGPDQQLGHGSATVVTKKLVGSQTLTLADFADYDRKIWICRDPRDFLVSQSLYRWHREEPPIGEDRERFAEALDTILAKEADPGSVPFLRLKPVDYAATFDAVAGLWRREGDESWFLYRYEDMIAGRYRDLNRYLGFDVEPDATVAAGLERVVRRKAAGDWRDWFTERDVRHYRSGSMADYMATFGYDHEDWTLNPEPHLAPEHGSQYVRALFEDHRSSGALAPGPDGRPRTAAPSDEPAGATRRVLDRLLDLVR